jgi:hypothetical protein
MGLRAARRIEATTEQTTMWIVPVAPTYKSRSAGRSPSSVRNHAWPRGCCKPRTPPPSIMPASLLTDLRTASSRLDRQLVQSAAMAFAAQQMKEVGILRSIAKPLAELWQESITMVTICQVVARRTRVSSMKLS